MNRKNGLLTIGEMSKFTGAGIKALHYYEQIGALKPAYTAPDSGYRYYSLSQAQLIWTIKYCVELDIPLKDLYEFTDADSSINYRKLLELGEEITSRKIAMLERGLKVIGDMKRKVDLFDLYQVGQIYFKEVPEKVFYLNPCGNSRDDLDNLQVAKSLMEMTDYEEDVYDRFTDFGILGEYSPEGVQYYTFIELPKFIRDENTRTIPGGTYFCRYGEGMQIKQVHEIFKEYLEGSQSFLAIETEIIVGNYKINSPLSELRIYVKLPQGNDAG